jgi:hypothetical protein
VSCRADNQQDLEHEHNTPTRQDTDDQQDLEHEHNTPNQQDAGVQQSSVSCRVGVLCSCSRSC